MDRKLLLISNSTLYGSGYLDHCADNICQFLGKNKKVLFVPFARPSGISHEEYTKIARKRFERMGYSLFGINSHGSPIKAVEDSEAIFIGGGNTFVLLNELYKKNLVNIIRQKVTDGIPYIGTSAGSNVACKSIKTTNDMPIVYPPSFDALNLVPFNINPHYLDPDPNSTHKGETRETRIKEFHYYNTEYVVGLREGSMLHINGKSIMLKGTTGARVFKKNTKPKEFNPGDSLDFLIQQ
jgi:dipeptidase E